MRFAFAGIDFLGGVFTALVEAGWRPVKLFTRPCDGIYDFNDAVVAQARRHRIPMQLSRVRSEDLDALAQAHGDVALVVAGYPWLITGWRGRQRHALNFHPSPLPTGRGPYPLFRAILQGYGTWGVTAHVLGEEGFDTGDILAQRLFPTSEEESHETLLAKCQMAAAGLAREAIAPDLAALWRRAEPQGDGSYWPRATEAERTLDFRRDVAEVLRQVRAFGAIETIARLGDVRAYVAAASGWTEAHAHVPGRVVHRHRREVVVAARDGYVQITRWSVVPLAEARETGR